MYYTPSDRTLLHCIPIAAPATRRQAKELERKVQVSFGFVPQYYAQHLGIRFGREWHENCEYRYETLIKMKTYLHQTFPHVEAFYPRDNGHGFDADCATLSGVYGSKLLPLIFGFDVYFPEDDWPNDASTEHFSKESLRELKYVELNNNPFIIRIKEQMEHMKKTFGKVEGYMNYQGVLNTALKLRGNDIFIDMLEDEDFVDELFGKIADVIEKFAKWIQSYQRKSGYDIDMLSLSNCVVNMISPELYERFVLPHDKRLASEFPRFGIHTCNWKVTPYLESIRQIPNLGYLDMGSMSDISKARRMFPESRLAVMYSPVDFLQKPLPELEADIYEIVRQAAPCDIVLADLTEVTEAARLNHVLQFITQLGDEIE